MEEGFEEEKEEVDDEEEQDFGGITIKGAAHLFKEDNFAFKSSKPKRVQPINEDKYFNSITKLKPKYLLKTEDKKDFFYEKVGRTLDHYKDLIKTINQ